MSKLNAFKHGILCQDVLLKDENIETLENLRLKMIESIKPVGYLEEILVERVIVNLWRLRRIIYVERDTMEHYKNSKEIYFHDPKLEANKNMIDNDVIDKILRYETNIEKGIFRALREIERLQAKRNGEAVLPPAVIDVEVSGESFVS